MKIRRRVAVVLAALVTGLLGVATAAAPAQASVADCNTPVNHFCIWKSSAYAGEADFSIFISPGTGGFCVNLTAFAGMNNNTDSAALPNGVYSRSITLYRDINCSGPAVYFIATPEFGGTGAGSCWVSVTDNWSCGTPYPGDLPSSVWVLRR